EAGPGAACLLGPGPPEEARPVGPPLPVAQECICLRPGDVRAAVEAIDPALRHVLREPLADLVAEGLLFGGQREIHASSCITPGKEEKRPGVTECLFSE